MTAMVELSQDSDVGVVGAKLRFPDGSIENCGVAVAPDILPYCPFRGYPAAHPGHLASLAVNRDFSAVTGACQMTRTDVFMELDGYDTGFGVDFGDIDYCLRARRRGYRVVVTPRAELMHFEAASRPRTAGSDAGALVLTVVGAGGSVLEPVRRDRPGLLPHLSAGGIRRLSAP